MQSDTFLEGQEKVKRIIQNTMAMEQDEHY